jgi:hypothetical protein
MEDFNTNNPENKNLELENIAIHELSETRKWTLFLSIAAFVIMGLMFIFFIIMAIIPGGSGFSEMPNYSLIPALIVMVIYFFPIYYLFQFSNLSKQALINMDKSMLTEALTYLKKHYRFMGIFLIVMIGLYLILFLIMFISRGSF